MNSVASEDALAQAEAFDSAVVLCRCILRGVFRQAAEWVEGRLAVACARRQGRVLTLDKWVPWQEHVLARADQAELLFVVYPSLRGGWSAQQIPVEPHGTEGRKPFPETWAGLAGAELQAASGVPDAIFCHNSRYMAAAESMAGAVLLAAKAAG